MPSSIWFFASFAIRLSSSFYFLVRELASRGCACVVRWTRRTSMLIGAEAKHACRDIPHGLQLEKAIRSQDDELGDVGDQEAAPGCCVLVALPVVGDVLCHVLRRALSRVSLLEDEDFVLRHHSRRQPGEDDFALDWCPPYVVLDDGRAFRRLGPPAVARERGIQPVPERWERHSFRYMPGFDQPCWLVRCALREVSREIAYDRSVLAIFPYHNLRLLWRSLVGIILCVVDLCAPASPADDIDIQYAYATAPRRIDSGTACVAPVNLRDAFFV
ncbi:hypothetical protein Emed_000746 [Eimeria media]